MNIDNPKGIESSVSNSSKQRRTFLKRASVGAVIASIPGRSAWAGIAGSIVASGHGSDFNQGACTKLLTKDDFTASNYTTTSFSDVFDGLPFDENGSTSTTDLLFSDILTTNDAGKKGISDVNVGLVVMYLNAINDNNMNFDIVYPVIDAQHGGSSSAFAEYLYTAATNDPSGPGGVGTILNTTITTYSSGVC